ncbi:alpha/beta-hydrolase [Punctularia strigosozonata HHB-11173 SS5]|uniref:alpha/beta-hydrolase n=1 Tax=Punctularia strigosozonata (strain HHB-11173) TaxID=741275 RepID=UPI0004417F3D|nr:alpha/beta-hydrolase [Punctularia strigosozonata HHB-11173 SS5]EIN07309.1 alpha/beta-hydrolase [Punctularia strigosozonata HHB-11173 SS5]
MPAEQDLESYTLKGGIKIVERFFDLPLDYGNPNGQTIRVFARNCIPLAKAKTPEEEAKLPYLVYLQGGPGFEVPLNDGSGFAAEIYEKGYQILWLDQRGTGLSTPISPETLTSFETDSQIANYLKHFRADSIVKDCEAIRNFLLGNREDPEDRKWTIMGQSFGGFCSITYLSFHSEGLKEVFVTGGLAPLIENPTPNYEATVNRVIHRNKIYYAKYPRDVKRVRNILDHLSSNKITLPNGGRLTPSRWQQLGIDFGMSGGIDRVHQLVFRADNDLSMFGKLSYKTLQLVQEKQSYDGNPIYAILHEPIYCQGHASNWAAARVIAKHPEFSWVHVQQQDGTTPVYYFGEMIFPDMFDDYANLRPLKAAAEILARDTSWGRLYDLDQLGRNTVKVSAVTYYDDMYVDFNLAQETARKIKNTEQYITNQLVHDGIRADAKDVMKRLFELSNREFN